MYEGEDEIGEDDSDHKLTDVNVYTTLIYTKEKGLLINKPKSVEDCYYYDQRK